MTDTKVERCGEKREIRHVDAGYGFRALADKHGLSMEQAERLIFDIGNDRQKLDAAAQALKRG